MKKILLTFFLLSLFSLTFVSSATEDFTTYEELDPETKITLETTIITAVGLEKEDSDTWVYYDKGSGYFDDFTHTFDGVGDTMQSGAPDVAIWGLSNVVDSWNDWDSNTNEAVAITVQRGTDYDNFKYYLEEFENSDNDVSITFPRQVWTYLKAIREGTNLQIEIYSDVERTSLEDTLSITLTADRTYQHIFICSKSNSGSAGTDNSYRMANLDLNAGAPEDEEYPIFSNYYENNASLIDSGLGLFNVTVTHTNGTVVFHIDGNDIPAFNDTADVYNASYIFSSAGDYDFNWSAYGNGTDANLNTSETFTYTVNESADTTVPSVTVVLPLNQTYTTTTIQFNVTALDETEIDSCLYSLNSGIDNFTMTNTTTAPTVWNATNLSIGDGGYEVFAYCNDSSNNWNVTESVSFNVDSTEPNCVLISRTPSDIEENSTGIFEVIVNCSDSNNLNGSSALIMTTIENFAFPGIPNYWSIRPPSNNKGVSDSYFIGEQIFIADGRGDNKWYDSYANDGINMFDDNFTYSVQSNESIYLTITEESSTQFILNFSREVEATAFRSMVFLRRGNMEREYKINQNYEIYRDNPILIKVWNLEAERGSENYTISVFRNINYSDSPNKNLNAYVCNSSYTMNGGTSPADDILNCILVNSLSESDLDNIYYSPKNSTYSKGIFSAINGMLGGIVLTNYTYLYYESSTQHGAGYYNLRYSNGSSGTNVSFIDSNVSWSSNDDGVTFSDNPFTPDIWLGTIAEGDEFDFGVNIEDEYGNNYTNFSFIHDDIGDVNHPISNPTIIAYQDFYNTNSSNHTGDNEDLNGTYSGWMSIHVGIALDPDSVGNVTHNLTLHNIDGSFNYTINASFLSSDDSDVHVTFNTSEVSDGVYRMNVTAYSGDDVLDIKSFIQENNFTINQSAGDDITPPDLNITYPLNTTYHSATLNLSYTTSDETALDSCWYSKYYGLINSTIVTAGVNWTGVTTAIDSSNNWTIWCNDSSNNVNQSSVTFYVGDVTFPTFFNIDDNNATLENSGTGVFNVSVLGSNGTGILTFDGTNYTASSSTSEYLCYQESANVSTVCGGLSTGVYWNTSTWNASLPAWQTYDGDWDTAGATPYPGSAAYMYVNYTIPTFATNNSLLQYRFGATVKNVSLDYCMGNDDNLVQIRVFSHTQGVETASRTAVYCWEGSYWYTLQGFENGIENHLFYEEGISWNMSETTYNTTVPITSGGVYDYFWNSYGDGSDENHNQSATQSYTVNITDIEYPQFSNYWDDNATLIENGTAHFNVTILSTNGTVWINFQGESDVYASNVTADVFNVTVEVSDTNSHQYYWSAYGNGTDHLLNNSETRHYSANVSTTPIVNITYPIHNAAYSGDTIDMNYTVIDDADLSMCWWGNETDNSTAVSAGTNWTGLIPQPSTNWWQVWCNDSKGNVGNDSVSFKWTPTDLTNPAVTINNPLNQTYTTNDGFIYNVTATDNEEMDACWYSFNAGLNNASLYNTTYVDDYNSTNKDPLAQGSHTMNFYCNDTSGNINDSEIVIFFIDSINPDVNLTYPLNTTYSYTTTLDLNYTMFDVNAGYCWYSNLTDNSTAVSAGTNWTGEDVNIGNNNWTVWCNDSLNNVNFSSIEFEIEAAPPPDTEYPIFSDYDDNNASLTDSGSAIFNVTVTHTNGTVWLELDGNNYTANNLTATMYNVSIPFSPAGDYNYFWGAYGNGSDNNINTSATFIYTINTSAVLEPCREFKIRNKSSGEEVFNIDCEGNTTHYGDVSPAENRKSFFGGALFRWLKGFFTNIDVEEDYYINGTKGYTGNCTNLSVQGGIIVGCND